MPEPGSTVKTSPSSGSAWWRRAVVVVAVATGILCYVWNRDALSLENLILHQDRLRTAVERQPVLILGLAFLVYVVVTGLSLPGAGVMSLVYGWLFGFWRGVLLVSFASTAGATIAFLLSRFLFREAIQSRFPDRLKTLNENLERDGAFYLFTLRLIPQVPFFLINLLMGLTPIRTTTFWWVSQLGMLPGTCVYLYAGSSVGNLEVLREKGVSGILTWQLILAFTLLGVFPLLIRQLARVLVRHSVVDHSLQPDRVLSTTTNSDQEPHG